MTKCLIRPARPGDEPGAYAVCLKTGDYGRDGEPFYREDPDALGRVFVGPYLAFEQAFSLMPWTTPPIIGHYLVSGGDWRAGVWGAVSIGLAMTVYYSFAKAAERQRLQAAAAGGARA